MPKLAANAVPSYRLHKQSGQAIVTLDGKDHLLGKHGSPESETKYQQLTAEWQANGRHMPVKGPSVIVGDITLAFWKHAKAYYRDVEGKPTGEVENFRVVLRPFNAMFATLPVNEFTPSKLRAFREAMVQTRIVEDPDTKKKTTRPGWCRTNANRQMNRIRQIFKWAVGQEMIPTAIHQALMAVEPLKRGRSEARETAPVRPVAEQHVDQVLDALPPAVKAMVELQELTGARGGELFKLRGIDIDMSQTIWVYRPALHKTAYLGHERIIRFGPQAQKLLCPFLQADLNTYLFSPARSEADRRAKAHKSRIEDGTPLSCGNRPGSNRAETPKKTPGQVYDKDSYARAIANACDAAFPPPEKLARIRVPANGRKAKSSTRWETVSEWKARLGSALWAELVIWQKAHRFHPHQIRHSVATRVRRDYGLEAAQAVLGQRSIESTQIYAEVSGAAADRVISEIG